MALSLEAHRERHDREAHRQAIPHVVIDGLEPLRIGEVGRVVVSKRDLHARPPKPWRRGAAAPCAGTHGCVLGFEPRGDHVPRERRASPTRARPRPSIVAPRRRFASRSTTASPSCSALPFSNTKPLRPGGHGFGQPAGVRHHDRHAGGLRLERRQAERFWKRRRHHAHRGVAIDLGQLAVVVGRAAQLDARVRRAAARAACRSSRGRRAPSTNADRRSAAAPSARAADHALERVDQHVDAFALFDAADVQNRAAPSSSAARPARTCRRQRRCRR